MVKKISSNLGPLTVELNLKNICINDHFRGLLVREKISLKPLIFMPFKRKVFRIPEGHRSFWDFALAQFPLHVHHVRSWEIPQIGRYSFGPDRDSGLEQWNVARDYRRLPSWHVYNTSRELLKKKILGKIKAAIVMLNGSNVKLSGWLVKNFNQLKSKTLHIRKFLELLSKWSWVWPTPRVNNRIELFHPRIEQMIKNI